MNSLETSLTQCVEKLDAIVEDASKQNKMPSDSQFGPIEYFKNLEMRARGIERAISTIKSRQRAENELDEILKLRPADIPGYVLIGEESLFFPTLRFLKFQGYIATTWSIYDQVTTNFEKLCGIESKINRLNKTSDLVGSFLLSRRNNKSKSDSQSNLVDNDELVGFRCRKVFGPIFGGPAAFSYKVRNSFVHEGGAYFRGIEAFDEAAIDFNLIQDARQKLEDDCTASYSGLKDLCGKIGPSKWGETKCLHELLKLCHSEIDEFLGVLGIWISSSIETQYKSIVGL